MTTATEQTELRQTFRKGERLHHRTLVTALYSDGEGLYCYPLRLQWRGLDAEHLESSFRNCVPGGIDRFQMMITVPKKRQRRAVDRVLMRRRIREAYRLNRQELLGQVVADSPFATISAGFVYIADSKCSYRKIEKAMRTLLSRLAQRITSPEK